VEAGDTFAALDRQFRLLQRPNLDAFYAMLRWSELPSAAILFNPQCLQALTAEPQMYRSWIGLD
jgi:hypothetical protein